MILITRTEEQGDWAKPNLPRTPSTSTAGSEPLTAMFQGWHCLLPTGEAGLWPAAAALTSELNAHVFKLLFVMGPHKLVEACWGGG